MPKAVSNVARSQEHSIIKRAYALKAHQITENTDLHFIRLERQLAGNQQNPSIINSSRTEVIFAEKKYFFSMKQKRIK